MISLAQAIRDGRLEDFIAEQEARSLPPVDKAKLESALAAAIKPPPPEDRTSRSASRDGSSGK